MTVDYRLDGNPDNISIVGDYHSIGIATYDHWTDNQTREAYFRPQNLRRWAEAVEDIYGREVRVVFTPDAPIVATAPDEDSDLGVSLAPMVNRDDTEEEDEP